MSFNMKKERIDPVKALADNLIEQMKNNSAPWQKPWEASMALTPHNAMTGKPYRGFNNLALMLQRHDDPRWLTFKQAKDLGYSVKKGEKGIPLLFYSFDTQRAKRDDAGKVIKDKNGNTAKETVRLERPIVRTFYVFNAKQIDGIPPYERPVFNEIEVNERAEALLTASKATIIHKEGDKAFYNPMRDHIVLPLKDQFKSKENYYATALHELGHWSGHESRLNRDIINRFGSMDYAREELRAEISSMLVGQEIGIRHDPSQHAAYTKSWISILEDEPKEILYAVRDAQKIFDYVMQYDREYTQQQDIQQPEPSQAKEEPELEEELER